jgi:hypothetical protein
MDGAIVHHQDAVRGQPGVHVRHQCVDEVNECAPVICTFPHIREYDAFAGEGGEYGIAAGIGVSTA